MLVDHRLAPAFRKKFPQYLFVLLGGERRWEKILFC